MVGSWLTFGKSVRGAAHTRRGVVNQDALNHFTGDPSVVAVADGLGGKKYIRSQEGSRLAVEAAIEAAKNGLYLRADMGPESLEDSAEHLKMQMLLRWQRSVDGHFAQSPFTDDEQAVLAGYEPISHRTAYACTLLWAVAYKDLVLLIQCGDGDILGLQCDCAKAMMDDDEYALGNETTPLSALRSPAEIHHKILIGEDIPNLIALSTDGVKNSFDDTNPADNKFYSIPSWIKSELDIQEVFYADAIETQLAKQLEKITTGGSGDDVTIGVLARSI